MSDRIELRGLRCTAVVGVSDEERRSPQALVFDLDVVRPFARAARDDDVRETTNYADVLALVARVAADGPYRLLETVATRVASEVLALDPAIAEVSAAVRKLHVPVPEDVDSVGVRTTLRRA